MNDRNLLKHGLETAEKQFIDSLPASGTLQHNIDSIKMQSFLRSYKKQLGRNNAVHNSLRIAAVAASLLAAITAILAFFLLSKNKDENTSL